MRRYTDKHIANPPAPDVASAFLYALAHPQSVELIKHSAGRGMSRQAMERIWGQRLVNAVLITEHRS